MKKLIEIFEQTGIRQIVAGNQPMVLHQQSRVWLVQTGQLDLFCCPRLSDGLSGRRSHVHHISTGELLLEWPQENAKHALQLLAVGSTGTQIVSLPLEEFVTLAQDPQQAEIIQPLLTQWLLKLSAGLGGNEQLPRIAQKWKNGTEATLCSSERGYSENGLVRVEVLEGALTVMGREDWPSFHTGATLLLPGNMWLASAGGCRLSIDEVDLVTQGPSFWELVGIFHEFVLIGLAANVIRNDRDEARRLNIKAETKQNLVEQSLGALNSVLTQAKHATIPLHLQGQPLFIACQAVCSAMNFTIQPPPQGRGTGELSLGDISRASRFRTRDVLLRGEWWRRDNGPLLAFLEEEQRPVALLPQKPGRYHMFDPVSGEYHKLSPELIQKLSFKAYYCYRPFADRALGVKDILQLGFSGQYRDLLAVGLMGVLGGLLGLITPIVTGIIFDTVIPNAARAQMIQIACILLACAVATALFNVTRGIAMVRLESRMDNTIQSAVWDRILSLPVPFFREFTAGDLANRSMGINAIRQTLSGATVTALLGSIFSTFNLGLLFYYDIKLAVIGLLLTCFAIFTTSLLSYLQLKYQRRVSHIEGKISGVILQFITGIAKLRVSGTEDRAFAIWAEQFAAKKDLAYKAGGTQNWLSTFNALFPILAMGVIFYWMGSNHSAGLSTGQFLAFNAAYGSFQGALMQTTMTLTASLAIIPLYERIKPILSALPETDQSKAAPGELTGEFEANHIFFRYTVDGPLILKDVSIQVEPGQFVAIVGGSGSGKSTLLRLLLGFENPESGSIYYDGQALDTLDVREVRRQTGVVLQNGKLMSGSIFENIVGHSNLTIDDAWEAARMVGFDEDIKAMPMGMHTMVAAGGGGLSGGQRQRLIIASAVVKRPRILFFDEATSALDNRTQAIVSKSLEGLNVARVVIAHRLSTIIKADRVYVLQHGEVIESGNYEELMNLNGFFTDLAKRQIA